MGSVPYINNSEAEVNYNLKSYSDNNSQQEHEGATLVSNRIWRPVRQMRGNWKFQRKAELLIVSYENISKKSLDFFEPALPVLNYNLPLD